MLMKAVMPKKFQLNVIPDFRTFLFPDGYTISEGQTFCLHR